MRGRCLSVVSYFESHRRFIRRNSLAGKDGNMSSSRKRGKARRPETITRRRFLQGGTLSTVGLLLAREPAFGDDIHSGLPTFFFRTRRGRDLLDLEFRFVNFTVQGADLVALGS